MKDFEEKIKKYQKARGWGQGLPGNYAKSIAIEAAELLEHFQWSNPTMEEVRADKEKMKQIQKELADVMIYCFQLSILLGFDTEKILKSKLAEAAKKYPAKLISKAKKDNDASVYWKIKKEHRMKGLS